MLEWSVEVEVRGIAAPDNEAIEELLVGLSDCGGVLALYGDGYSARLSVTAGTPGDALRSALQSVRQAARDAGLAVEPIVRLELVTADRLDAELLEPVMPTLMGVAEIAELLGVSRQRISELASTDQFPEPAARLAAGPIWTKPAVVRFLEQWERRPGRKTKPEP